MSSSLDIDFSTDLRVKLAPVEVSNGSLLQYSWIQSALKGWDRTFLNLSSRLADPFCKAFEYGYRMVTPLDPTKFNNRESVVAEVATRTLIAGAGLAAAGLTLLAPTAVLGTAGLVGLASKAFRYLGYAAQENGFTHIRTNTPEKVVEGEVKIMNWNVLGVAGGMHFSAGGAIRWPDRIDRIVAKIEEADPDVLVLEEIYDTDLGEELVKRLGGRFAHFFTHLGPNVWGGEGGLMVLSKCAVHSFTDTSFDSNSWQLNRTFATLEIKASPDAKEACARIIGTHLIHRQTPLAQSNRLQQFTQIVDSLAQKKLLPTVLAGDLNIERDGPEGEIFKPFLEHGYTGGEPTCTNRLAAQWTGKAINEEVIDYISLFKQQTGASLRNCRLVRAFDETYNTKTALSDHHGLIVTLNLG